jgi:hypothetical protein
MSRRFLVVSMVLLLSSAAVAQAGDIWSSVGNFPDLNYNSSRYAKKMTALMAAASDDDLTTLTTDCDSSIAIAALWEELQRGATKNPGQFHRQVEQRLHISLPKFWTDSVQLTGADNPPDGPTHARADDDWQRYVHRNKQDQYEIGLENGKCVLKTAGLRFVLPGGASYEISKFAVASSAGQIFIAIVGWEQFELFAFDRKTQKVLWSHNIDTRGEYIWLQGLFTARAALMTCDDRVFVFADSGLELAFSGFRMSDGKELVRFSTSYSDRFRSTSAGDSIKQRLEPILPPVQTDAAFFEIDSRLLVESLRLSETVAAPGPIVGVMHNSVTQQIVAKGRGIVPLLCERLRARDLNLDEAEHIILCLAELKADAAKESVDAFKRDLASQKRFAKRGLALDQMLDGYYAALDLRDLFQEL